MWRDLNFDEPYSALQQPEQFEGLTDLTTLAEARQIWEYGAAVFVCTKQCTGNYDAYEEA
jgi:hypothetical protein